MVRLFISHKDKHKAKANALASVLEGYPSRITITAGLEATQHSGRSWHVPKAMLISNLEAHAHSGELRIAAAANDAHALKEELKDFKR